VEISRGGVPGMVDGEVVQVSTYAEFESTKLSVHLSLRLFGAARQKRPFTVLLRTVLDVFSG
jgi:alpha-D-ribose 1-methylphosphonate 5-phosphate C-P lyase